MKYFTVLLFIYSCNLSIAQNRALKPKADKYLFVNLGSSASYGDKIYDRFGGYNKVPNILTPFYFSIEYRKVLKYRRGNRRRDDADFMDHIALSGMGMYILYGSANNTLLFGKDLYWKGFVRNFFRAEANYIKGFALNKYNHGTFFLSFQPSIGFENNEFIPSSSGINFIREYTRIGLGLGVKLSFLYNYSKKKYLKAGLSIRPLELNFLRTYNRNPTIPLRQQKKNDFETRYLQPFVVFDIGIPLWSKVKSRKRR